MAASLILRTLAFQKNQTVFPQIKKLISVFEKFFSRTFCGIFVFSIAIFCFYCFPLYLQTFSSKFLVGLSLFSGGLVNFWKLTQFFLFLVSLEFHQM